MTFTSSATNDLFAFTDAIDVVKEFHARAVAEREEFVGNISGHIYNDARYDEAQRRVEVFEDILEAFSTEESIADLIYAWNRREDGNA